MMGEYVLQIYAAVFCWGYSFCLIKVHHAYSLNSGAVLIRIHVCLMLEKTCIDLLFCSIYACLAITWWACIVLFCLICMLRKMKIYAATVRFDNSLAATQYLMSMHALVTLFIMYLDGGMLLLFLDSVPPTCWACIYVYHCFFSFLVYYYMLTLLFGFSADADLCEDPHRQDYHPWGGVFRHHW